MAATTNQTALSLRVNDLFGAYVTAEAEQARLAESGDIDGADALSDPALAIREEVFAIRDRSGNADLIAARILLDLMLGNYWKNVVPGYEWRFGEVHEELPLLEIVADRTTGVVREHTAKALATIGVEVAPVGPDPFVERMAVYAQEIETYNTNDDDDDGDEPGSVICQEVRSGKIAIGSAEGAILALRRVIAIDCMIDTEGDCMVEAVIAFLEGPDAPHIEADVEPSDPLLSLVTEYRTQLDSFNASPRSLSQAEDTALEAKTWRPSYDVLSGGDVPNATTLPGAVAALRELHREFVDCGGADEMVIAVLPAVVALFDTSTAQQMKDRATRVSGS